MDPRYNDYVLSFVLSITCNFYEPSDLERRINLENGTNCSLGVLKLSWRKLSKGYELNKKINILRSINSITGRILL